MTIKGVNIECNQKDQIVLVDTPDYAGQIVCPDIALFCNYNYGLCSNFCNGKGRCNGKG